VATLRQRGWTIVEPEAGHLASGAQGDGRLAAPERIVDMARQVLGQGGDLAGWHVAVTAGGTREAIDPVRYISNRSSGKMGYALAEAARDRGAMVSLISTAGLTVPEGVRLIPVERAAEMCDAVLALAPQLDALVMAAAVADYRPASSAGQKIKKSESALQIELEPTTDILEAVAESLGPGSPTVVVGFAAETENLMDNARAKLVRKRLDVMVANDVTLEQSGFGSDLNKVTILRPDQPDLDLPLLPKLAVSHAIWDAVLDARAGQR
jgi:phosphopantothenoylcysteine decarboxylase / phosphopantothenate---cysteine ligase